MRFKNPTHFVFYAYNHKRQGYHDTHFTMIYKIAKVLNVSIDTFAKDFEEDNFNIFLNTIKSDVEPISKNQLNMTKILLKR